MADQGEKYNNFKKMHFQDQAFVIPNPWDAGSARILTAMGFEALATTSAGYAFSVGRRDSFAGLSRDEILDNAAAIVAATDLPVSADLEDGFGASPDACAQTIDLAVDVGLVGGSIEDATGDPDAPIFDLAASTERIVAAAEAARGKPFLLTARAENHLWGRDDLGDTIRRLQSFSEAGADVLYHDPFVPRLEEDGKVRVGEELTDDLIASVDAAVIVTNHSNVDHARLLKLAPIVVDSRNATKGLIPPSSDGRQEGWIVKGPRA